MKPRLQLEGLEGRSTPAALDLSATIEVSPAECQSNLTQMGIAIPPAPARDGTGDTAQHEVGHWMGLYRSAADGGFGLAAPQDGPAPASFDAFLKLEGIDGESDRGGTQSGAGKVAMQDIHFVARSQEGGLDLTDDGTGDDADGQTIAVGGYIRIKKLHSGGG